MSKGRCQTPVDLRLTHLIAVSHASLERSYHCAACGNFKCGQNTHVFLFKQIVILLMVFCERNKKQYHLFFYCPVSAMLTCVIGESLMQCVAHAISPSLLFFMWNDLSSLYKASQSKSIFGDERRRQMTVILTFSLLARMLKTGMKRPLKEERRERNEPFE
jgi:hypothetical protein